MTETENRMKNSRKTSPKKKLSHLRRSVKKAILGFICAFGVLCVILICLRILIKGENRKAVNDFKKFKESNNFEIIKRDDKTFIIKGCYNGIPFNFVEDGKLCEGIKIGDIDVSGLDYSEAHTLLSESANEIFPEINTTVSVGNTCFMLTAGDFGITSNINDVLHEALKIGRKHIYTDNAQSAADNAQSSVCESMESYQKKIHEICHGLWQDYDERQKAKDGPFNFDIGFYMDDDAISELVDKIADYVNKNLVNTVPVEPDIALVDRLTGANSTSNVPASDMDIYDKITVYTPFGTAVADIIFIKGSSSFELDREDLTAKLKEAFNNKNYDTYIEVTYKEKEKPKGNVEDLFASMKKITSFSTEYKSSGRNRSFNLFFGASKLNCMVMEPGVEISFNEHLGERREIDGWKPAHQIVNGNEYVDTPGGGLCQISTTLYNALMQAGAKLGDKLNPLVENPLIEIIARSPHSIPSDYVDLGLDATVSFPNPDLKWKCIGNSKLYLFAYTDNENKILYMDIYGSFPDDGYTYKIYSKLVSTSTPEEPEEIPEPTWPEGFDRMMIKPRKGYTADVFLQKYDSSGNKVGDPVFIYRDVYSSVRGKHHYGTGDPTLPKPDL